MAYNYDSLYGTTPDALGAPTQIFVDFFQGLEAADCRVLDIGCGQGRDALFIARLGHKVVGVDLSANGIQDLNAVAKAEGLPIMGVVADLTTYTSDEIFDIILIDRTLHMLDETSRLAALERLATAITQHGWLLIADEKSNIPAMKTMLDAHAYTWEITYEKAGYLFAQRA